MKRKALNQEKIYHFKNGKVQTEENVSIKHF